VTGGEDDSPPTVSLAGHYFSFPKSVSDDERCALAGLFTRYHLKYEDIPETLLKYEIRPEKRDG
jgi:hypothetical protein